MATNWPNSVQTFTNPTAGSALNSPSHADQHATVNDTVEALQQYAGLVFIKSQTIGSGVSSVTVTGAFSATFDHYRVIVQINTSSSSPYIGMTIGSSTSGYYGSRTATTYAGAFSGSGDNNASKFSYLAAGYVGSPMQFSADIRAPFIATETQIFSSYVDSNATSGASAGTYSGFLNNSTSHSYFTIAPSTGTITGGTIRVYGYNNG
jgi:hypothetical protein